MTDWRKVIIEGILGGIVASSGIAFVIWSMFTAATWSEHSLRAILFAMGAISLFGVYCASAAMLKLTWLSESHVRLSKRIMEMDLDAACEGIAWA